MSTEDTNVDKQSSLDDTTYAYDEASVSSTSSESDPDSFTTNDMDGSDDGMNVEFLDTEPAADDTSEEEARSIREIDVATVPRSEDEITDDVELRSEDEVELRSKEVEPRSKREADIEDNNEMSEDKRTDNDNAVNTNINGETSAGRPQRERRPPQDPLNNIGSTEGKS